jgi:large subunit ribosomal protein L4
MPKKMRRLARNSAILAQIQDNGVVVLDGLSCPEPKTKVFASMLSALGVDRGCVLALEEHNNNIYRSGRNVPNIDIRVVNDLSAYDVLRRPKLIFTRLAFERLTKGAPVERSSSSGDSSE